MRKASEAKFYALTTATACALALIAGVVGAPARAVIQDLVFDQYQRWQPRPYAFDQPVRVVESTRIAQAPRAMAVAARPPCRAHGSVERRRGRGDRVRFPVLREGPRRRQCAGRRDPGRRLCARDRRRAGRLGQLRLRRAERRRDTAKAGFVTAGDDATKFLTPSPGALAPLSELAQHAAGVGFLNWRPDSDRVVRRVPLILNVDGALHPSLAMEALRVAQGASTYIVKSSNASGETAFGEVYGVLQVRNGDLTIDTDAAGDIRTYFARPDPRRSIPAWKALDARGGPQRASRRDRIRRRERRDCCRTSSRRRFRPRCRASKPMRRSSSRS